MTDDTAIELAKLAVAVETSAKSISDLTIAVADANARNADANAELSKGMHALQLDLAKNYATYEALRRVEHQDDKHHKFAMERVEMITALRTEAEEQLGTRITAVEEQLAEGRGVRIGYRALAAIALGTVTAASGVAAIVATALH